MTPAVLVSLMGVLTVVSIYFWWVRKLDTKAPAQEQPASSGSAHS